MKFCVDAIYYPHNLRKTTTNKTKTITTNTTTKKTIKRKDNHNKNNHNKIFIIIKKIVPYKTILALKEGLYRFCVMQNARQEPPLLCQPIEPFADKFRKELISGCIQ